MRKLAECGQEAAGNCGKMLGGVGESMVAKKAVVVRLALVALVFVVAVNLVMSWRCLVKLARPGLLPPN